MDAILMAVQAYSAIEMMIAKDFAAKERIIFNVGTIQGGTANNIIADRCAMYCTLRTWNEELADAILDKIRRICEGIATVAGGRFSFVPHKHYPIVYNDPTVTDRIRQAAAAVVGEEKIVGKERTMGGEDFSYFARLKPACMFRLGVRNEKRGFVHGLHNSKFDLDEDSLAIGIAIYRQFIRICQTGLEHN